MSTVYKAVPTLGIALAGVGLAYLFFEVSKVLTPVVIAAVVGLGFLSAHVGEGKLRDLDPVGSLKWMELGAIRQAALASGLVGFGIWLAVKLEPSETASVESKKLLAAAIAAVAAFLTAALIKSAEDTDANWLAPKIQKLFREHLRQPLSEQPASPDQEQATQALESPNWRGLGWGYSDRRVRAKAIAKVLP
jgi:hypothetical protein